MAAKKSTRADKRTPVSAADADEKLYEEFRKQPAQLTVEQMGEIEKRLREDASGPEGACPYRRAALASLTSSMQRLMDSVIDDVEGAQVLANVAVCAKLYADRLNSLVEMLKVASARIEVALCVREDATTILEMARAEAVGRTGAA